METDSFLPWAEPVWHGDRVSAAAAIRLASIQSVRLRKQDGPTSPLEERFSPLLMHRHILQALAAWPETVTISLNLLTRPEPAFPLNGKVEIALVVTVAGSEKDGVVAEVLNRAASLYALLATFLDEAEFEMITDRAELLRWLEPLRPTSMFLIDRFRDSLALTGTMKKTRKMAHPVGFLTSAIRMENKTEGEKRIDYLFPWHQERFCDLSIVLEALLFHRAPVWLQVRLRPARISDEEKSGLEESLVVCEELLSGAHAAESILYLQAKALREAISERLWQQNRRVFQGACLLASEAVIDDSLVTAVANEISSMPHPKEESCLPVKGGFSITPLPDLRCLSPDFFSPNGFLTVDEAACVFRVPWPEKIDPQGLPLKGYRSALISPVLLQRQTKEMLLLGTNRHSGHISTVRIADEDRMRHTFIMGQTGTGKSVFLESMILQDIERNKGVCFIDPHGDSVEKILHLYPEERIDDLVLLDFQDPERIVPFNLLAFDQNEERDRLIDNLYSWVDLQYDMKQTGGPIFELNFRAFLRLLMDQNVKKALTPTILDFLNIFLDRDFREFCLDRCTDIEVTRMINQAQRASGEASLENIAPYITSKFNRFFSHETIKLMTGQKKMALDFQGIMDTGKVLLVNLGRSRFDGTSSSLLASQIVSRIQIAAMGRGRIKAEERRDFFLYVDEFQNVASEAFIAMLAEARKFRLGMILANQYANQLDKQNMGSGDSVLKAVLGNVGNTTCFRLGISDAHTMAGVFHPDFNNEDLVNLPIGTCYVNLKTQHANPCTFSLDTRYIEKKERPDHVRRLRARSNARYTISLDEAKKIIE